MLILQTLLVALISGLIIDRFWFSYILVLIFLGGILILFIYVAALASNEQINMNPPQTPRIILILAGLFLLTLFNPSKNFSFSDRQKEESLFN